MARIVRLTERDLTRLVKKFKKEISIDGCKVQNQGQSVKA